MNYLVLNISSRYGNTYKHTRDLLTIYKCKKRARLRNQCIQKGGLQPSVWQTSLISTLLNVFWNSRASKFKHHSWKQKKNPPSLKAFQGLIGTPEVQNAQRRGYKAVSSIRFTLGSRYVSYYWCLTQNNSQKVYLKKGSFYYYLLKLLTIEASTCENIIIVPTIGLLLQIHNKMCTLHTFPSTVEILENSIWNCLTLFFK